MNSIIKILLAIIIEILLAVGGFMLGWLIAKALREKDVS